jgi:spore coat polysaccharide biosynthesis predicted glycosyltransferase SpsG
VSGRVVVVAQAGPAAGLGHLSRSSAVAAALAARGLEPDCRVAGSPEPLVRDGVAWSPLAADEEPGREAALLVLDGYLLARHAETARGTVAFLHGPFGDRSTGRLVLDPLATGSSTATVLRGLEHACLRPAYWGIAPPSRPDDVRRVLVTTGSLDTGGGAGIAAAVRAAQPPSVEVALVRGPYAAVEAPPGVELVDAPESLLDELLRAGVVVTAAGQTSLEAVATGAATVVVPAAPDQRLQAERLAELGVAVASAPDPGEIAAQVEMLAADRTRRRALEQAGPRAVDGLGALRVAYRLAQLLS